MNGPEEVLVYDEPPRYLPNDLAGFLRERLATHGISNRSARADMILVAEMCFQRGNGEGYNRGFLDGQAERDAQAAELGGTALGAPLGGGLNGSAVLPPPVEAGAIGGGER